MSCSFQSYRELTGLAEILLGSGFGFWFTSMGVTRNWNWAFLEMQIFARVFWAWPWKPRRLRYSLAFPTLFCGTLQLRAHQSGVADWRNRGFFLKWKYAFSDSDLPSGSHSELSGVSSLVNCIFPLRRKTEKKLLISVCFFIFSEAWIIFSWTLRRTFKKSSWYLEKWVIVD